MWDCALLPCPVKTKFQPHVRASLIAQLGKNLPAMQETRVQLLGREDLLGRKWQLTPVLLPGESHGQRSLAGYNLWSHNESDMTECLILCFAGKCLERISESMQPSVDLPAGPRQWEPPCPFPIFGICILPLHHSRSGSCFKDTA